MITFLVRRTVPFLALVAVLGSLVRGQRVPAASADAWFHLRFGREFLDGWSIRHPGHLGVYDTADWTPTQWLSQVAMAWVDDRGGIGAVVFAAGLLVLGTAVATFLVCRAEAAPLPAVIATALCLMAASPGLSARPQLFSYLLVVLTVGAWLATARDGAPRYWLIGLAWVWPMLHGMWPVGISISVVAVVGVVLQGRRDRASVLRLGAIPVLSLLVSVLNPLGLGVVRALFDVGARSSYFAEWGPADFTEPAAAVLAAVLALVVLAGFRSEQVDWPRVLLALLGLAWSLYSLRTTPIGALILAPLLASALQRLVPETPRLTRREVGAVLGLFVASGAVLAIVATSRASERVAPTWLDERLDALPAGTTVLDDWTTGSYLLARHPGLQLVMHGYGDVFTDDEIERNADLARLRPGWDLDIDDLAPDIAVLDPDSSLGYAVEHQLGWTRLEGDDEFVVLAPPQD